MIRKLLSRKSAALPVLCMAVGLAPSIATADNYVGDLVYCDVDANGIVDGADYPLNGVNVHVTCIDDLGATCADVTTTTGVLDATISVTQFNNVCGAVAGYDPAIDFEGRYLVGLQDAGCSRFEVPWSCSIEVDRATLPEDCSTLVTPREGGFPMDNDNSGDLCQAGDGPFPEGQYLGFDGTLAECGDSPDPLPIDNTYLPIINPAGNRCALYNDFGYTGGDGGQGATRTPGYWKNHPTAVAMFLPLDFCGETITEVCDAVELLSLRGGGQRKFTRHAIAGLLNCAAFGCPDEIANAIADGSAACDAGTSFPYNSVGTVLDIFNNSGEDIEDDLDAGPADPAFCEED